jgi:hypothetical protein
MTGFRKNQVDMNEAIDRLDVRVFQQLLELDDGMTQFASLIHSFLKPVPTSSELSAIAITDGKSKPNQYLGTLRILVGLENSTTYTPTHNLSRLKIIMAKQCPSNDFQPTSSDAKPVTTKTCMMLSMYNACRHESHLSWCLCTGAVQRLGWGLGGLGDHQ